ncbi:16S rRNA (cytosine(1402)-N(4))-methyltransferase [Candidatus Roizmanbacteria bacterium RIFCSPLOWO2_01_FULL_37_12]|uniref:Ribosomal RNA small subunit methyltransferase H n=1 Tax=Candidatus Roizmanbacteria bacterium RIFCSPLOWO2_01_FULL_37_12 TaxID=1802056 RepID=A0A1F7IEJ1_9BACT|nr:MAG: 16S rRNA (cytosine(1402)-N(4))-methyltransferase [Candidatus Roizmanbacteria bacterium RIFCSPHIGHO2_02_FULL_37_9b]OGK41778.1 MAG: 16S rRNA (cytosine(1402)-N(4))-methyltransferase [Candidatus Roizmanbacteria bacterium RIFCSPLOWO2_01_FULL_37_12]
MHTPVLLKEAVEGLSIKKDGLYIDATVGEGGHLIQIAQLGGKVLGIEIDRNQINKLTIDNSKIIQGNFKDIEKIAIENNFFPVDGILLDLGLSVKQIKNSGRGFSYRNLEEPLDMRLSTTFETTASKVVNSLSQDELYEIFAKYSEDINSLAISKVLVRARTIKPIEKVKDLINIINQVIGETRYSTLGDKTYARIFQALRIAVNNEIENLRNALAGSLRILKKTGRVVVISFHSIEDRTVKQFISNNNLKQFNKKVIVSKRGLEFERSAKMRIICYETSN